MSKKLYVKLQTPSIELDVTATDSSGEKDKIKVGFKRPEPKAANILLDKYSKLSETYVKYLFGQPLDEKATEENRYTVDHSPEDIEEVSQAMSDMVADSIVYIKGAKVLEVDNESGASDYVTIPDTRKAKPNEDFWEDAEGCLDALLGMFLAATPWKSSLSSAYQKTLINIDTSEAKRKN